MSDFMASVSEDMQIRPRTIFEVPKEIVVIRSAVHLNSRPRHCGTRFRQTKSRTFSDFRIYPSKLFEHS